MPELTAKEESVLAVLAQVSGHPRAELQPEQDLAGELGIDSPKALHLLMELESKLQIEISDEDAARLNTVGDVLEFVKTRIAGVSPAGNTSGRDARDTTA